MKLAIYVLLIAIMSSAIYFASIKKGNFNMAQANSGKKVLVAYFSRTGEQYGVGNITEGNTAIIAKMIAEKTKGDLFEIKPAVDNYPKGYTALTEAALAEKNANARPEISGKVDNFEQYEIVFVGYPNWWGDLPMPVYTFLESYDFSNKTIIPFITHEGSGLSGTPDKIREKTKALKVSDGFAITGTEAQKNRESAETKVNNMLKKEGF